MSYGYLTKGTQLPNARVTGLTALVWFASCGGAWANAINPAHPPQPFDSFLELGLSRSIGRLLFPFLLTFLVEIPVVVFTLRGSLTVRGAGLASIVMSAVTYPIVFYLYWWRGWGMVSVEILAIGMEFVLLLGIVGTALKVDSLNQSPTIFRLFFASTAANLASWFAGWVLLG